MDAESILGSRSRPVSPRQPNMVCRRSSEPKEAALAAAAMSRLPNSHPGLQCAVGGQGFQLSREAMLVGTVAALQEESGQMRHEWKADVMRLESELQQLRSAAAVALPHVRTDSVLPLEANLRFMSNGPATDTSSNISGRDAVALQGMLADRAMMARGIFPQQNNLFGNTNMQNSIRGDVPNSLESLLAERSGGHSLLSREAAQLDAVMLQGAVRERAGRDHIIEPSISQRSNCESQGINLAEAVLSQMRTESQGTNLAEVVLNQIRNTNAAQSAPRDSTDKESNMPREESKSMQIKDLYIELERMTLALQESEQENSRLREEKETSINAHSRDIAALEAMLQQLTADNDKLSKQLAEANGKLQQLQMDGLDPDIIKKLKHQCGSRVSTPASIRSASIEPATEPDIDHSVGSTEIDKLKFKVGLY